MASFTPLTSFRIAQVVGFGGTAWLSGNIATFSLNTIPALRQSHTEDSVPSSVLARQWSYMYEAGKSQNPPIAAAVAASFSYLAWSVREGSALSHLVSRNSLRLYSVAALLTVGIVPFTILAMSATNEKLLAKAEKARGLKDTAAFGTSDDDEEVAELLRKWSALNGIRSLIPLLGGAAAVIATLA